MTDLKKASLYVKTSDDLPGNFHEVKMSIGFSNPIATSFTFGLVEETEYLEESIGKHVLSYNIEDEEYFVSLTPENKACLTLTGGDGALHEAFLLMESIDTALALIKTMPTPHENVTSYTIYKVAVLESGNLIFEAIYKNDYIRSLS